VTTAQFESLLKDAIGLDATSIGSSAVERAVRQRQRACGIDDPTAYWAHVSASAAELQALVETVVVPETWFFRDPQAFVVLRRIAQEQGEAGGTLHLLSLPCSTGEEPYSMAMALAESGLPHDRFHVDGVDVSEQALAHARRGSYGRNSFRGSAIGFRDRSFDQVEGGYRLKPSLQARVRFQQGNLFGPTLLPGTARYDVIFCRNVLIYFDRADQARAFTVLSRLLTADGWLFVGPSETAIAREHGFSPAGGPMSFGFRRAPVAADRPVPSGTLAKGQSTRKLPPNRRMSAAFPVRVADPASIAAAAPAAPEPTSDPVKELQQAIALADAGRFDEAAARCEAHARQHGPSAATFALLGVIREAVGDLGEANASYRKALYLDPHHEEALMHLALLMERAGQDEEAGRLRARARRVAMRRGA
jgi:chemotaxis protein methyltransferase WspC